MRQLKDSQLHKKFLFAMIIKTLRHPLQSSYRGPIDVIKHYKKSYFISRKIV